MAEGFMALRESTENLDRRTGGKPKVRGGRGKEESAESPVAEHYRVHAPVDGDKGRNTEAGATLDLKITVEGPSVLINPGNCKRSSNACWGSPLLPCARCFPYHLIWNFRQPCWGSTPMSILQASKLTFREDHNVA